jgi:hypothetical protein
LEIATATLRRAIFAPRAVALTDSTVAGRSRGAYGDVTNRPAKRKKVMAKKKARKSGKAKTRSTTSQKVVNVKFIHFKSYETEVDIAVPKKTTKEDLTKILAAIAKDHPLIDFENDFCPDENPFAIVHCTRIGDDVTKADFIASLQSNAWGAEKVKK